MAVLAVVAVAGTKDAIDSQFWNRRDLNRAELTAPAKARHREPAGEDSFARGSVMVAQPTCSTRLLGDQAVEDWPGYQPRDEARSSHLCALRSSSVKRVAEFPVCRGKFGHVSADVIKALEGDGWYELLEGAATHDSSTRRKPVESRFRTPKRIFLWEPCGALNVNPA